MRLLAILMGRVTRWLILSLIIGLTWVASPVANAATVTSLLGDKDCFGLGGSCPDGTLWRDELGGVFSSDYSSPLDPAFTDRWFAAAGITYTHTYDLGGETSVAGELELRIAGVADNRGPWDVFLDGVLLGQIPTNNAANAFQEVLTYIFSIPVGLLDGSNLILLNINVPEVTDGYSIDFSELRVRTVGGQVPAPSTILLLGSGLAGLAGVAWRRSRHE